MKKITTLFTLIGMLTFLLLPLRAFAKDPVLSVIDISTDSSPGYTIYWPKNSGMVKLTRAKLNENNWENLAETETNFYVDKNVVKGVQYSYKLLIGGTELVAATNSESSGKPVISDIMIEAGTTTKQEATIIVNFKTDKLAQAQVFYGESTDYQNNTELTGYLNQTHTIMVKKLVPGEVYHLKLKAVDKNGQNAVESDDQTFTAPLPPTDQTILEIIIQALSKAFSNFEKWFNS